MISDIASDADTPDADLKLKVTFLSIQFLDQMHNNTLSHYLPVCSQQCHMQKLCTL